MSETTRKPGSASTRATGCGGGVSRSGRFPSSSQRAAGGRGDRVNGPPAVATTQEVVT
jgi:hypothetical protein